MVLLDAGIAPADVTVRRDGTGDDLLLTIAGASNTLRIKSYFFQDGASTYALEQVKFADGTVWSIADVKAKALQGTAGNDTLVGYASADTLDGGAGNDWIDGRGGSDTYKFGKASGNDTISESSDSKANTDVVLLDAGIATADVAVRRDGTGDDLLLTIAGASNTLRIKSYFYQDGKSSYALEQVKFADGTVWDYATVKAKAGVTALSGPVESEAAAQGLVQAMAAFAPPAMAGIHDPRQYTQGPWHAMAVAQ